jgi:hypothetical protein
MNRFVSAIYFFTLRINANDYTDAVAAPPELSPNLKWIKFQRLSSYTRLLPFFSGAHAEQPCPEIFIYGEFSFECTRRK